MQYIVAVNTHRHFVKASESLGISQSTLSMMIRKLEEELDTAIFYRDAHPIKPTEAGEKLIAQAEIVLFNARQFAEIAAEERKMQGGKIRLGVIPTVASDLIPLLFESIRESAPNIQLETYEMKSCDIIKDLQKAHIDMALMATPLSHPNLLEIPVYYEHLYAYVSPSDPLHHSDKLVSSKLPLERLWSLQPGNCLRDQVFNMCDGGSCYTTKFEAGSIDTIVKVVDRNGGFTVIPELHLQYLSQSQLNNIRELMEPEVTREISLVIREDYIREGLLNQMADALKSVIPASMIDKRLQKFAIKI